MINHERLPRKLYFAMPYGSWINSNGEMARPDENGRWIWCNGATLGDYMTPYTSEEVRHVMKIRMVR